MNVINDEWIHAEPLSLYHPYLIVELMNVINDEWIHAEPLSLYHPYLIVELMNVINDETQWVMTIGFQA